MNRTKDKIVPEQNGLKTTNQVKRVDELWIELQTVKTENKDLLMKNIKLEKSIEITKLDDFDISNHSQALIFKDQEISTLKTNLKNEISQNQININKINSLEIEISNLHMIFTKEHVKNTAFNTANATKQVAYLNLNEEETRQTINMQKIKIRELMIALKTRDDYIKNIIEKANSS